MVLPLVPSASHNSVKLERQKKMLILDNGLTVFKNKEALSAQPN